MREEQQITALMIAVFIVGLGGLFLMGGIPGLALKGINPEETNAVYVDDYKADLYLNGTLDEHFKYNQGKPLFGKVFRQWDHPLSFQKLEWPYVEAIGIDLLQGAIPYLKSWQGDVKIITEDGSEVVFPKEMGYETDISSLAMRNEMGCYNPERFGEGQQEISYIFKMHPPIEQDEKYCHWNLKLAEEHLPYRSVNIKVHDPEGYIVHLFTHPNMDTQKVGDAWVITGSSKKDDLLELEMILKADAAKFMDGFPRNVSDILGKTLSANKEPWINPSESVSEGGSAEGGVVIERYSADVYLNGTIQERFQDDINTPHKYSMLYRNWRTLLSTERLKAPYAEPIKVLAPKGTVAYVKDFEGKVWILSPNGTFYPDKYYEFWPIAKTIKLVSSLNEAGYYITRGPKSPLIAGYRFKIHPAIKSDGKNSLLSLSMANRHLPYDHMTITIHDPKGEISRIFTRPKMDVSKNDQGLVVSGQSGQDVPLEVNMLLSPDVAVSTNGFVQPSQDVEGQFLGAESDYFWKDTLASIFSVGMRLLVLLAPLVLFIVYRRYGKERSFTVPGVLSFIPNGRKPWQVNLVFKWDPFDFDRDGFYATILNLERQGLVDIQSEDPDGFRIKILKGPDAIEDNYERKVLMFLSKNAENDVFSVLAFEANIEKLRLRAEDDSVSAMEALHRVRDDMNELVAGPGDSTANEFFMSYGKAGAMLIALPIALIFATGILFTTMGDMYPQLAFGFYSSVVFLVQSSIPAFVAPKTFFGRWKADYYKEKLEWDAFKKFLSDFAMIQKYAPEDTNIWKDWLVYGTALGVGKKVVKAMEQLEAPALPEAHAVVYAPSHFEHIHFRSSEHVTTRAEREAAARQSSGWSGGGGGFHTSGGFHSGGGGGFGGGGGHGGGGGGAR